MVYRKVGLQGGGIGPQKSLCKSLSGTVGRDCKGSPFVGQCHTDPGVCMPAGHAHVFAEASGKPDTKTWQALFKTYLSDHPRSEPGVFPKNTKGLEAIKARMNEAIKAIKAMDAHGFETVRH